MFWNAAEATGCEVPKDLRLDIYEKRIARILDSPPKIV
jgi:hypothetical protein